MDRQCLAHLPYWQTLRLDLSDFFQHVSQGLARSYHQTTATASPPATIQYGSLDTARKEIRLFRLTGVTDEVVSGIIETFDLHSVPNYQALSYTWGDEYPTKTLETPMGNLSIRMNLYRFLKCFNSLASEEYQGECTTSAPRFEQPQHAHLWIDQICINQENIEERNAQALLMSELYSPSRQVICWPSNSESEMKLIERMLENYNLDRTRPPSFNHAMNALMFDVPLRRFSTAELAFMNARYWKRVWVQQELAQAKALCIFSGHQRFMLRRDPDDPWHREVMEGTMVLTKTFTHSKDSLERCLWAHHHCQSTDPRDHIFGLMSLVRPEERIQVDYSLTTHELWWLVLRKVLIETKLNETTDFHPELSLRLWLYSEISHNLGIHEELYRDMIRTFVIAFWNAKRTDPNLTLKNFENCRPDPHKQWAARRRPARWLHTIWHGAYRRIVDLIRHPSDDSRPRSAIQGGALMSLCAVVALSPVVRKHSQTGEIEESYLLSLFILWVATGLHLGNRRPDRSFSYLRVRRYDFERFYQATLARVPLEGHYLRFILSMITYI